VATNNWRRPVYFANVNSVGKVMNVDKYCHMEGVVYRFKPTKAKYFIGRVGGVDSERSWKILMDSTVRWGRLNEPDVVVDRESYRNSAMEKQSYLRLAQALINDGDSKRAVEALDKGLYFFPYEKFIYDYYTLPWSEIYYKAKAFEKGDDILKKVVQRYKDDLDYYLSLDDKFMGYYQSDIQEALAVLQRASRVAKSYGRKELSEEFDKELQDRIANSK